jgi:hypothetical protein
MTTEQKAIDYSRSIEVDYHKEKFNLVINAYYAGYTQCQEDVAEELEMHVLINEHDWTRNPQTQSKDFIKFSLYKQD